MKLLALPLAILTAIVLVLAIPMARAANDQPAPQGTYPAPNPNYYGRYGGGSQGGYPMGPGMVGPGVGPGYMGPGGWGPGRMTGPGYTGPGMGPGYMSPGAWGPGRMAPGYGYGYGYGQQYGQQYGQPQAPMTQKDARKTLENYLASLRNPNLKLGQIRDQGAFYEADIRTKENSLVDKILVDKKTGFMKSVY